MQKTKTRVHQEVEEEEEEEGVASEEDSQIEVVAHHHVARHLGDPHLDLSVVLLAGQCYQPVNRIFD